jgi:hypothetical protein
MKKEKKDLTKLALAGLLLASTMTADVHASEVNTTKVLLAVAGCPAHGCGGKTPPPTEPPPPKPTPPAKPADNQVADAAGDLAVPRSSGTVGGGYSRSAPGEYRNVGGAYSGTSVPGSYSSTSPSNRGTSVGGGYGVPENRPGTHTDAGSWGGTAGTDVNRARVQEYNYNSYNTNRNFETSPTYEGRYLDSSYYSDTVAPYGAPRTGFRDDAGYQGNGGSGYESVGAPAIMTEAQLFALLSPEGRKMYSGMDPEGKALALQLASQANYSHKDLAVREAYTRMQQRRSYMRNQ